MSVNITSRQPVKTGTRTEFVVKTYTAGRREDCADNTDKMVFDLVLEFGDVIRMGEVTGRPA